MARKRLAIMLMLLCLSMGGAVAGKPDGAVYLDGGDSKNGLILAHGKGRHPTWLVVDPVRKGIHQALGYHTLSLQMPTGYRDWKAYADGFPLAYSAIEAAIAYLKHEKGVTRVYLFGHSMGGRMASSYLAVSNDSGVAGLIVAGCRNNGRAPLSCAQNLLQLTLPVLDVWGGNNARDSRAASERRDMRSNTYTQVAIAGTDHTFNAREEQLIEAVATWLKGQNQALPPN